MAIKDELSGLGESFNLLVIVSSEQLQTNINEAILFLTKDNTPGIYISLNKPYTTIKQIFKKNSIKTDNMFFIDCITASVSEPKKEKNVLFVPNPSDLAAIGIAIGQFLDSIPENKFLVMDALRTLLIYNSSKTICAFMQSLTSKSSGSNLKTVIFTTDGRDRELVKKITPFFDKVIEL